MKEVFRVIFLLSLVIIISCDNNQSYIKSIEDWRHNRIEDLTARIGWSSLAGLFWLDEGVSWVGTGKGFDISFSENGNDTIGKITLDSGSVIFESYESNQVTSGNEVITKIKMLTDKEVSPTLLQSGQYFWTIIDRNEKMGLRLWDTTHIGRTLFRDLDFYDIDPAYKVEAEFIPYESPEEISLKNILGMDIRQLVPGVLEFSIKGNNLSLLPIDGGNGQLFLIFSDLTTGGETYGGGRYLYCDMPDSDNHTVIDFNKSFTPPCGFTEFATCLLPRKENNLGLEILAGEKYLFDH